MNKIAVPGALLKTIADNINIACQMLRCGIYDSCDSCPLVRLSVLVEDSFEPVKEEKSNESDGKESICDQ